MSLAVVDYGSGNVRSVTQALVQAAPSPAAAESVTLTGEPETVARAERVVLPGVGAFGDCKAGLAKIDGMLEALAEAVRHRGAAFLGICVGMQLMAQRGLEYGEHPGLGWLAGDVTALQPGDTALKIPHMGWNTLSFAESRHPVLAGLPEGIHTYFVHSYALTGAEPETVLATSEHGASVTAVAGRANVIGTQFHPEKSQAAGLKLLSGFWHWQPR